MLIGFLMLWLGLAYGVPIVWVIGIIIIIGCAAA